MEKKYIAFFLGFQSHWANILRSKFLPTLTSDQVDVELECRHRYILASLAYRRLGNRFVVHCSKELAFVEDSVRMRGTVCLRAASDVVALETGGCLTVALVRSSVMAVLLRKIALARWVRISLYLSDWEHPSDHPTVQKRHPHEKAILHQTNRLFNQPPASVSIEVRSSLS